jgi:hypothetical protein
MSYYTGDRVKVDRLGIERGTVDIMESERNVPAIAGHTFAFPDNTKDYDIPATTPTLQSFPLSGLEI